VVEMLMSVVDSDAGQLVTAGAQEVMVMTLVL
jgi:hypothetical protein